MRTSEFDFDLPESAIARYPEDRRDRSRLMLVDRRTGEIRHHRFLELPDLLRGGDLLVTNDTRVMKARIEGRRARTGGRVELLLVEPAGSPRRWRALAQASKPLRPGAEIELTGGRGIARVVEREEDGLYVVDLPEDGDLLAASVGVIPLPPYLGRKAEAGDDVRYQTVYAREDRTSSVAAPTAGLHFTPAVLAALAARGVDVAAVTLHVGPGTFLPVRTEELDGHRMHSERCEVTEPALARILRARGEGRIVAVGTTVVRTLESLGEPPLPGVFRTNLFIRPGFSFRFAGALLTNFHLPRSTLLMLVAAFAGRDRILGAYEEALRFGYRFFSYGDAMLIV